MRTESFADLLTNFGFMVGEKHDWRMILGKDRRRGEIQGLPASRGTLVATDGIRCLIVTGTGFQSLFEGHLDWFIPEKEPAGSYIKKIKKDYAPPKDDPQDFRNQLIAKHLASEYL